MKYILWWQDQHFQWHRYQEQYGHTSAYNTALKRANSTGKKYKIVPVSDISSDRSFRNAWTVDEADLTDGVGE